MNNIETYEQKYKNALSKARNIVNSINVGLIGKDSFEAVFPELKESRDENADEKVRKALIKLVTNHASMDLFIEYDIHLDEALSWLEKQRVQKPYSSGTMNEKGYFDDGFTRMMEKGQKPIDNVEPKFKVGDWVTDGDKTTQIVAVGTGLYIINRKDMSEVSLSTEYIEKWYHLWTIEDAKDGDVLVTDKSVFIYAKVSYNKPYAYCGVDKFGVFKDNCLEHDWANSVDNIHPATKKQRDTLMKAMADAGYTFDFEKKEIKKIEQPHAWSEEDKEIINNIILVLSNQECWDAAYGRKENLYQKEIYWLKSLKDKVQQQPKQEWNKEDEVKLYKALSYIKDDALKEFINSLKYHKRWKPSDKQINALSDVLSIKDIKYDVLSELLACLKKLT